MTLMLNSFCSYTGKTQFNQFNIQKVNIINLWKEIEVQKGQLSLISRYRSLNLLKRLVGYLIDVNKDAHYSIQP